MAAALTNDPDLELLLFVANRQCSEADNPKLFPCKKTEWDAFVATHGGLTQTVTFSRYNKARKVRTQEILSNVDIVHKWWLTARAENDLLASALPSMATLTSGSLALGVCPGQIKKYASRKDAAVGDLPKILCVLRANEIKGGMMEDERELRGEEFERTHPNDYPNGAQRCKGCGRYSIPINRPASRPNCLSVVCAEEVKERAEAKAEAKKLVAQAQAFRATRNVKYSCTKCRCSIQCRKGELQPRTSAQGNLLVQVCYLHRTARHEFLSMTEVESAPPLPVKLVCSFCTTLRKSKCRKCKCYLHPQAAKLCDKWCVRVWAGVWIGYKYAVRVRGVETLDRADHARTHTQFQQMGRGSTPAASRE